jgi:hypothetical protein
MNGEVALFPALQRSLSILTNARLKGHQRRPLPAVRCAELWDPPLTGTTGTFRSPNCANPRIAIRLLREIIEIRKNPVGVSALTFC